MLNISYIQPEELIKSVNSKMFLKYKKEILVSKQIQIRPNNSFQQLGARRRLCGASRLRNTSEKTVRIFISHPLFALVSTRYAHSTRKFMLRPDRTITPLPRGDNIPKLYWKIRPIFLIP